MKFPRTFRIKICEYSIYKIKNKTECAKSEKQKPLKGFFVNKSSIFTTKRKKVGKIWYFTKRFF